MQASKFAKKYVVIRNRSWFNKLRQLFSVTKSVFFSLPKMRQLTPNNFTGQVTQIQPYAFCVKRQSVCNLVFPFSCWSDIFEEMNFFLLIFVILTTTIFAFPISSEFVNENNFFSSWAMTTVSTLAARPRSSSTRSSRGASRCRRKAEVRCPIIGRDPTTPRPRTSCWPIEGGTKHRKRTKLIFKMKVNILFCRWLQVKCEIKMTLIRFRFICF